MNQPSFRPQCLSIDLEVGKEDGRIHRFAAIRGDTGESITFAGGDLGEALVRLDALARGAAFLLGHNLIAFDRPHLAAADPTLQLLRLPDVDTLRLSPLAFPRNPYHHLVKHYQDASLTRGQLNDPKLDAESALRLFADEQQALTTAAQTAPALVLAWHWLTTRDGATSGTNAFFTRIRQQPRPTDLGWPMAYALAWLSVAGGNSVMPPWVRHEFPEASRLVRQLRDTPCQAPTCAWCGERHDAVKELKRWFGFEAFRAQPPGVGGRPLQQCITEAAMRGQ